MSVSDNRGNPVSYGSQAAVDRLDDAFALLHAYQADPVGAVDAIIAEHPGFAMAHAFRAGMFATATDKTFERELIKSVSAAESGSMSPQRRTLKSSTATAQVGNFAAIRRRSECAAEPASDTASSPSPGLCPTKPTFARDPGNARARARSVALDAL